MENINNDKVTRNDLEPKSKDCIKAQVIEQTNHKPKYILKKIKKRNNDIRP